MLHSVLFFIQHFLDLSDVSKCLLLNSHCYSVSKLILNNKKSVLIHKARDCIDLCQKTHDCHLLSTICFELFANHRVILKLNYNNLTINLIHTFHNHIKLDPICVFKDELFHNIYNLISCCPSAIDLYMFNIVELKKIIKHFKVKNFSKMNKKQLILTLRQFNNLKTI